MTYKGSDPKAPKQQEERACEVITMDVEGHYAMRGGMLYPVKAHKRNIRKMGKT